MAWWWIGREIGLKIGSSWWVVGTWVNYSIFGSEKARNQNAGLAFLQKRKQAFFIRTIFPIEWLQYTGYDKFLHLQANLYNRCFGFLIWKQ